MKKYWCKQNSPLYIENLRERFNQHVIKVSGNDCWLWLGSTTGGYGQIKVYNKNVLAHRVAAQLAGFQFDSSVDILHTCDNTRCVNPDHLFIGSHAENMHDKTLKGRQSSKLTPEQVTKIKEQLFSGVSANSIAVKLRVAPATIYDIKHGVTWRHIVHHEMSSSIE